MTKFIIEQDLEPIAPEPEKPASGLDDLDLEAVLGGEENEEAGDQDYQYVLSVKQAEDSEGDKSLEPAFTFILTPKGEEGLEGEDELEAIEDTSDSIEGAQAPAPSVPPSPAPLPESFLTDLEPLTEQEAVMGATGGENTPPPPPPADAPAPTEEPLPEEDPTLEEVAPVELSEEDLKSFIETSEIEMKFSIDEETEFNLDEAVDYLKLYPDSEIFVVVKGDLEEFKTKLEEFTSGKEEDLAMAGTEEQNVMVDNEGDSLDMKNTPQANPATPQVSNESFSIFNFKNKKNLPDGIYIGHLSENKLYGRIDLKLTPNKLVIGKDVFSLEEGVNITEARGKESIALTLKESDVEKFVALLNMKSDIIVKL